jgi:hypothetical protein
MTYERWQALRESLKGKFKVSAEGAEELEPGPGHVEFLECATPMGQIRLELEVRPRVLEKKTYYSKRAGSSTTVEYKYDENEHTLTLKAYRLDSGSGEWVEVKPEAFAGHV